MYDDFFYAKNRLTQTIVRTKRTGRLVRVLDVNEKFMCTVEVLNTDRLERVTLSKLDLTPVPLGYVQDGKTCTYIMRAPLRNDWRQGLRAQQVRAIVNGDLVPANFDKLSNMALYRTVNGLYPTFKQACRQLVLGRAECAFHRHWSIQNAWKGGLLLMWKGYHVGSIHGEKSIYWIKLHKQFRYLKEAVKEVLPYVCT